VVGAPDARPPLSALELDAVEDSPDEATEPERLSVPVVAVPGVARGVAAPSVLSLLAMVSSLRLFDRQASLNPHIVAGYSII
jgi:hypothetical protein